MLDWQRHVTPHGELQALDDRLWVVTATPPKGGLPRNMFIYRLDDGGLLVHGAHALREETMRAIEALGPLRLMIVSSQIHAMHEPQYRQRYPEMRVACPAAARDKVARDVAVDDDVAAIAGKYGFRVVAPDGVKPIEHIYEVPVAGGQAWIVGDMLMNNPDGPGFAGWLLRMLGSTGFFGMTGIGRLLLLKDRAAFKRWLGAQARRDDIRIIGLSHGDVITADAGVRLQAAADRL
jgi:hypothetical protein